MNWTQAFQRGEQHQLFRYLGAHTQDRGTTFNLWAPHATSVSVIGDFNNWAPDRNPLRKSPHNGIWQTFVPQAQVGQSYQFSVAGADGIVRTKADPMAFASAKRPHTHSILHRSTYRWQDKQWMTTRRSHANTAMSIYEVHLGSWKKNGHDWKSYRELAAELPDYVAKLGFTHVEFMPLTEHPLDESWGYQALGYFSPTGRYGDPDDLKYLIDQLHQRHIGVILDWVPVHFPTDEYGLKDLDGTSLYESSTMSEWSSHCFDLTRPEVCSFLLSSALFWLQEYHFDGLRVDAVTTFIEQDEAAAGCNRQFLQKLNHTCRRLFPGVDIIAEDSSPSHDVTQRSQQPGNLGFDMRWDMGWMHDCLEYFSADDDARQRLYHRLTFGMSYHYRENYIRALSHDEVVHGKSPLLYKMAGDNREEQFGNLRTLTALQWLMPGKKHTFMGNEIAAEREWDNHQELPWFLTCYREHSAQQQLVKDLNLLYRHFSCLHADHLGWANFKWLICDDVEGGQLAFCRQTPGEWLVVAANTRNCPTTLEIDLPELFQNTAFSLVLDTTLEAKPTQILDRPHGNPSKTLTVSLNRYSVQVWCPKHLKANLVHLD